MSTGDSAASTTGNGSGTSVRTVAAEAAADAPDETPDGTAGAPPADAFALALLSMRSDGRAARSRAAVARVVGRVVTCRAAPAVARDLRSASRARADDMAACVRDASEATSLAANEPGATAGGGVAADGGGGGGGGDAGGGGAPSLASPPLGALHTAWRLGGGARAKPIEARPAGNSIDCRPPREGRTERGPPTPLLTGLPDGTAAAAAAAAGGRGGGGGGGGDALPLW